MKKNLKLLLIFFIYLNTSFNLISQTIAAGFLHTALLDEDGKVWTFGCGYNGQLGHKNIKNQLLVIGIPSVIAIVTGAVHTLLLDENGSVWACGNGSYGKLGHGDEHNTFTPKQIENLPIIVVIAAGQNYTLLLDEDGRVWTFGYGSAGQLGHGNTEHQLVPKRIEGIPKIALPVNRYGKTKSANFGHTSL